MLSQDLQDRLRIAITDQDAADELIAAINSGSNPQAADVAANSPAGAVTVPDNTQASINTALASVISDINADRTQINAILTALKNAALML